MSDTDVTKVEQVPPHETSVSPVRVDIAMPQYFGLTPPTMMFGIATATLAAAIVVAVLGHWVAALVLAVVVLLEVALFLGVARRKPDTAVASASVGAVRSVRERALWLYESASVRSEAGRRTLSLRRELLELAERRERSFRDLGAATYDGDGDTAQRVTEDLRTIDAETKDREGQMREIAESVEERLREGRLRVQPTEIRAREEEE